MHPLNSKILYTCTRNLYRTDDATATNVQWVSMGAIATGAEPDPGVTGNVTRNLFNREKRLL
jgi:hypothetical protein